MIEERAERLRNRWGRHHPWLAATGYSVVAVIGLVYTVGGVVAVVADGRADLRLLGSIGFFALAAVVTTRAALRHVQIARDPTAEDARVEAIINQPREQLVRQARRAVWGIAIVLAAVGATMAATALASSGHPVQLGIGILLVVLGVGLLVRGESRLRDPDAYL